MNQQPLETVDGSNFLPAVKTEISLMNIIADAAQNPSIDVHKLSALIEMQNTMLEREKDALFASDLVKMLSELPEIEHDKKGDKSSYATFDAINKAIKPILIKYNFALTFDFIESDEKINTICTLNHSTGRFKKSEICLPVDKIEGVKRSDVQNVISSSSYGKRLSLIAVLGIVTKGDVDQTFENSKKLTDMQVETIQNLVNELPAEKSEKFLEAYPIDKMTRGMFQKYVNRLKKELTV